MLSIFMEEKQETTKIDLVTNSFKYLSIYLFTFFFFLFFPLPVFVVRQKLFGILHLRDMNIQLFSNAILHRLFTLENAFKVNNKRL